MHNKKRTAISLYTGAGGLDLGFEAAGFETCVAVEIDDDCVATLRANRDWPVIHRSIHQVPSEEILSAASLAPSEPDVLIGGPPCQPFSKCGYWANGDAARLDDPRATTVDAFLRVLRDTRPRGLCCKKSDFVETPESWLSGSCSGVRDERLQVVPF